MIHVRHDMNNNFRFRILGLYGRIKEQMCGESPRMVDKCYGSTHQNHLLFCQLTHLYLFSRWNTESRVARLDQQYIKLDNRWRWFADVVRKPHRRPTLSNHTHLLMYRKQSESWIYKFWQFYVEHVNNISINYIRLLGKCVQYGKTIVRLMFDTI